MADEQIERSPTCVAALERAVADDLADQAKKPATIRHYRKRLKRFVTRFGSREFGSLTPLEIKDYMRSVNRYPATHKRPGSRVVFS